LGENSRERTNLREGSVVPQITLVREAVAHEAKLALLRILLDRIESLLLGDLYMLQMPLVSPIASPIALEEEEKAALLRLRVGLAEILTSIFALVQRGTSTIMLRTVCCSLA
jgi:hypothetical protein